MRSGQIWGDNFIKCEQLSTFYYHLNSPWQSLPAWQHGHWNPIKIAFTHDWMPLQRKKKKKEKKSLRWHSYFSLWDLGSLWKCVCVFRKIWNNQMWSYQSIHRSNNCIWPKPALLEFPIYLRSSNCTNGKKKTTHQIANLARQMERFVYPLDLSEVSIRERDQSKRL